MEAVDVEVAEVVAAAVAVDALAVATKLLESFTYFKFSLLFPLKIRTEQAVHAGF